MKEKEIKKLIIGIGNEGRGDDGLGWRFAEKIESHFSHEYVVERHFQLQVEDAELISNYDVVIFVDASFETIEEGFSFLPCKLGGEYYISSHSQSSEAVLYLSKTLYHKLPQAHIMKISGVEWKMKVGLSDSAKKNLDNAFEFFISQTIS